MKKLFIAIAAICVSTGAFAQTEKGNMYVGSAIMINQVGAVPGIGFQTTDGNSAFQLGGNFGYFVIDNLAINAGLGFGYGKAKGQDATNNFGLGVGARYYIASKFPIGVNYNYNKAKSVDGTSNINFEGGYAYFVNESLAIEPMAYWTQPTESGAKGTFGVKIGVAYHF